MKNCLKHLLFAIFCLLTTLSPSDVFAQASQFLKGTSSTIVTDAPYLRVCVEGDTAEYLYTHNVSNPVTIQGTSIQIKSNDGRKQLSCSFSSEPKGHQCCFSVETATGDLR